MVVSFLSRYRGQLDYRDHRVLERLVMGRLGRQEHRRRGEGLDWWDELAVDELVLDYLVSCLALLFFLVWFTTLFGFRI